MSIYKFNNQILAISYRFVENRFIKIGNAVVVIVVLVSLYPLSLAGHLFQRRTFIYYCTSIRLCIGGQAALASAGITVNYD